MMVMATLTLPKETVDGLGQVANQMGVDLVDLAEKAIRQYLRREAEKKIAEEEAAFRGQHSQLLTQYGGQYVAMHNGQIIDSDRDELALFVRVRQQYPLVGILIKHVASEVDEVWQIRSPRLDYE